MDKDEEDNEERWYWRSTVVVRNDATGLETFGVAESPYLFDGRYDTFGRTKSASKAERNALRKQIPEVKLQEMLMTAETGKVQQQHTGTRAKSSGASSLQTSFGVSWSVEFQQKIEKICVQVRRTRRGTRHTDRSTGRTRNVQDVQFHHFNYKARGAHKLIPLNLNRPKPNPEKHIGRAMARAQQLLDACEYTVVTAAAIRELSLAARLIEQAHKYIHAPDDDADWLAARVKCSEARDRLNNGIFHVVPEQLHNIALLRLNLTNVINHLGGDLK